MTTRTADFIYDALRVAVGILCIVSITYALCDSLNIGAFQ
jgi:hypothetical protein